MSQLWYRRVAKPEERALASAHRRLTAAQLLFLRRGAQFPLAQSDAATPDGARAAFPNELNAHIFEGLHNLHQRIDVAPYQAPTGFHSLDGRQGQICALRKEQLVYAKQGACRAEL